MDIFDCLYRIFSYRAKTSSITQRVCLCTYNSKLKMYICKVTLCMCSCICDVENANALKFCLSSYHPNFDFLFRLTYFLFVSYKTFPLKAQMKTIHHGHELNFGKQKTVSLCAMVLQCNKHTIMYMNDHAYIYFVT